MYSEIEEEPKSKKPRKKLNRKVVMEAAKPVIVIMESDTEASETGNVDMDKE